MHNPLKFTDPSGYYPKELGNHPSPVTSDYNHDYTYGLGGGGFGQAEPNPFSFNNWWNAYIYASRKGFTGGLSNFQQQFFNQDAWSNGKITLENHYWTQNSETRNSEFYKVSTKHTSFITISLFRKMNSKNSNFSNFEPSRIDFTSTKGKVQLHFNDEYTLNWSIKKPNKVAISIKQFYKIKFGSDMQISNGSLALEIYIHALLYNNNLFTNHTKDADCGDDLNSKDGNRFFWDVWSYNMEYPSYNYSNYYNY